MSILWVLLCGGLLTYAMRLSFIYLLGRVDIPERLQRLLRYVPPAVLSAIIVPDLLLHAGSLDLSLANHRLLAGATALIVALWTRNPLATIIAGTALLLILQRLF